jgi:hypothetical protein
LRSVVDLLLLTAPGAAPGALPAPGVAGVFAAAFASAWQDAAQNNSIALWPGVTRGALADLGGYATAAAAAAAAFASACDGASFLAAFDYELPRYDELRQVCARRIAALAQQSFQPASPYEAFVVLCKGACRAYTAQWWRLQAAAAGTGCDCARDIQKGAFFCPVSAPAMLCRATGICVNESYFEASTCAASACGRFAANEKDWRAARRAC